MILSASPDFPGLYLIDDTGEPRWAICDFRYLSPGLPDPSLQFLVLSASAGNFTMRFDSPGRLITDSDGIVSLVPLPDDATFQILFGGMNTALNQGNSYLNGLSPSELTPIVLPYSLSTYLYFHNGAYAGSYSTDHAFLLPVDYKLQAMQGSDTVVKSGWAAEYRDFFTVIAAFAGMAVGSYYLMGMTAGTAAGSVAGAESDAAATAATETTVTTAVDTGGAEAFATPAEISAETSAGTYAGSTATLATTDTILSTTAGTELSASGLTSALTTPAAKAAEGILAKKILQPSSATKPSELTTAPQAGKTPVSFLMAGAVLLFFLLR